jgi:hypothetical protein
VVDEGEEGEDGEDKKEDNEKKYEKKDNSLNLIDKDSLAKLLGYFIIINNRGIS